MSFKDIVVSENLFKSIIKQLLSVVAYLNAQNIFHGGIKPENILIHKKTETEIFVKLRSVFTTSLLQNSTTQAKKLGSVHFMAPELLIKNEDYSKCDVWSIGVLTYNLLTGEHIFDGNEREALLKAQFMPISRKLVTKGLLGKEAIEFIEQLLQRNVENRILPQKALLDKWLVSTKPKSEEDIHRDSKFLEKLVDYANGNLLKRSVVNYMVSKNFYDTQNLKLLTLFQELDKDHSGSIDKQELFNHYGKYFPGTEEETYQKIEKIIANVNFDDRDVNHEDHKQSLNYQEFLVVCSRINGDINKEKLKLIFDSLDKTKSGFIELEDMTAFLKNPKIDDSKLMKYVSKYDKDGDKKISFEEFYDMISQ